MAEGLWLISLLMNSLSKLHSANSSRMGEKAKRVAHLSSNHRDMGRHNGAGIIAVPFRFFEAPCFLQGLAGNRIDSRIDVKEFVGFGLTVHMLISDRPDWIATSS